MHQFLLVQCIKQILHSRSDSKANLCFRCFGDGRIIDFGEVRVVLQPLLLWSFFLRSFSLVPRRISGFGTPTSMAVPFPRVSLFFLFLSLFHSFSFCFFCYPSFDPYCSHSSSSFFALFHIFPVFCSHVFAFVLSFFHSFPLSFLCDLARSHCCTFLLVVFNPVYVRTHVNLPTLSRRFKLCPTQLGASMNLTAGRRTPHAHRSRLDGPAR